MVANLLHVEWLNGDEFRRPSLWFTSRWHGSQIVLWFGWEWPRVSVIWWCGR